ncbi:MAG: hypothetical protein GY940_10370, partial [bacterium]|nr:hypothetical protein [bacterium]
RRDKESGFDLRKVPFRITLCKLEACKHLLIISYHHILYDGWSNGIILKEFFEVYDQLRKGRTFNPPEKTKFKEFVKWINLRDRDKEETFWKNYLSKFEGYEGDRQQQLAGIHR